MDPDELNEELRRFDLDVKEHGTAWAQTHWGRVNPSVAQLVITEYDRRIGEPLAVRHGIDSADHEPWYLPQHHWNMPRWDHARSRLHLPEDVIDNVSQTADEILARLDNPKGPEITSRGLVLGHVQSGKTTSFLSVAAKALDSGYDLVIILAGVHNSLRRQTQDRAERILVHNPDLWWLGTRLGDFYTDGNSLGSVLGDRGKRGLLVVKKHSVVLKRLADWLESQNHSVIQGKAILIIDDEADQAGLDVSRSGELEGVHRQLMRIVNLRGTSGNRCAYLAYTATPYANILTSQAHEGLYPRDFIYPLKKPTGYIGSEELFGDRQVGDPVRLENDTSEELLTDGLKDAVRWFVCATAARVGLGSPLDSFHSSMLIHTTQLAEEQKRYRPLIEDFLRQTRSEFADNESELREFYERTLSQVPAEGGGGEGILDERKASWNDVRPHIRAVLDRLIDRTPAGEEFVEDGRKQRAHSGVIVDNSKVPWSDRLTYSDVDGGQPSVTVIAIGGNTLSRGLTLEGLVCSYFARTARTYDTLMQMGRWFGFRDGYRHLQRVWTTDELLSWFRELDRVEQDLRSDLEWMNKVGLTPNDYGPRIRVSPSLNITRAAAMKSVTRHISYSDTSIDPAWIDVSVHAIENNQRTARSLAKKLAGHRDTDNPLIFRGVPIAHIRKFITDFEFHENEKRFDKTTLLRYITEEGTRLKSWNVMFKSVERSKREQFDFGGDVGPVTPVVRGKHDQAESACIGSLVDSNDHRVDVGGQKPRSAQYRERNEPPLLVVYAIDKTSTPMKNSKRVPLDLEETPISVSITLPESDSSVDYVSPSIDPRVSAAIDAIDEEIDDIDAEAIDVA